jgi:branched-chain amino acid transport system ATP-binding protein
LAANETVAGMSALLKLVNVSKRFGGLQAVSRLTMSVNEGEILGLIGPNGAGKSTVFNLVNGVYSPDEGQIIFDGKDITGEPPYRVAQYGIARAHQIVQPLMNLSVLDNCTVGACFGRRDLLLRKAREVASEIATVIGLGDRLHVMAASLTTAGKKRLEIARALSSQPRLLLLDEVLAGLNPAETESMIQTVRDIRNSGVSILMIEHIMRAIMSLSDRIVVLNLGATLAQGTPQEVANNQAVIAAYFGDPELLTGIRS